MIGDDDAIPALPDQTAREGAAADGADSEQDIAALPRFLRYACWCVDEKDLKPRLLSEIVAIHPPLADAAARWVADTSHWRRLASALDATAPVIDEPAMRSFADAVRVISMSVREAIKDRKSALRVSAAMRESLRAVHEKTDVLDHELVARVEHMIIGWSVIAAGDVGHHSKSSQLAQQHAEAVGRSMTFHVRATVEEKATERHGKARTFEDSLKATERTAPVSPEIPADHVIVCPAINVKAQPRAKDVVRGHEHAIGVPLPLVLTPNIPAVRRRLIFEFPYAQNEIDVLLAPLVMQRTVWFPPVVLVGTPGSGKSRLARRLAEELGSGVWRTDASGSDGGPFGGTERRWSTAEPAHSFLAVSRTRTANPIVIIDEIEKSGSRSDYGRLWDALLPFLERETACRRPDPCLQVELNLSHVSYVATANDLFPLPSPLIDRFRVIEMPSPRATDLERLIPPLLLEAAKEQGLDERWTIPLTGEEIDLLAQKWRGGSIRRLRAYVGVILRARDRSTLMQ